MVVRRFVQAEDGAVTVDWVVLTAAIVGIAIAVLAVIAGGLNTASNEIRADASSGWSEIAGNITASSGYTIPDGYFGIGLIQSSTGAPVGYNPEDDTYSIGDETNLSFEKTSAMYENGEFDVDPSNCSPEFCALDAPT